MSRLRRYAASPYLHFALIGGALFGAQVWISGASAPAPARVVEISAEQLEEVAQGWWRTAGRSPTPAELSALVEQEVEDELLLGEAIAMGWHRNDPVVQRRLLQNQRFLDPDSEQDDEALLARAYAQGMDRRDIVVRRRLIERMRLAIASAARRREPDDAELEAVLAANAARFERLPRVRVTQIYLSADRRGEALAADAEAVGARLLAEGTAPDDAERYADPLLVSAHLPLWSERMLASRLGPDFARIAIDAELGRWVGPVPSSYGVHYIWVHEREPARLPSLEEIRTEVRGEWMAEREREALREALGTLREGAEVRLPDRAAGL